MVRLRPRSNVDEDACAVLHARAMVTMRKQTVQIRTTQDVVTIRRLVWDWSRACGHRLIDQTKLTTAASEIARNTLRYGGGGTLTLETLEDGSSSALRLEFNDQGPGIPDVEQALRDGFSSGGGLGLGLGGARRLVNDFSIESSVGLGTRVTLTHWKDGHASFKFGSAPGHSTRQPRASAR